MNWTDNVDANTAEVFLAFLCCRFAMKAPRIRFSGTSRNRGTYLWRSKTIRVSNTPPLWVVAHEFAHYRDAMLNSKTGNIREAHSRSFFNVLLRVTSIVGEQSAYPWNDEYKIIRRWWNERTAA